MATILTRNFDGAAETDFLALVRRFARDGSVAGDFGFIYIVPTRRRVRELQRELVGEVTFGRLPVYTLELFAHEIFKLLSSRARVISPSMQAMLVSKALSAGEFRFFKFASARPGARKGVAPIGTLKKIVDQIGYLKENGITPDDYGKMVTAAEESEKLKLTEFQRIYSAYEESLGQTLVDSPGLLSVVNAKLSDSCQVLDRLFPGNITVLVEGFYNFKRPELDFLRLVSSDKRFKFLVKLDCDESNRNLFRTMISTKDDLTARGFKVQAGGHQGARGERLTDFLSRHLFADEPPSKRIDLTGKVFVSGVRDSLREAEFVAEKIREIISENPAQELDRICVASYLPQNYSRIFREVLRKYRLPANVTDRYTLESNNAVNAILSFIDVRTADYERVALMRAITNKLITVSDRYTPGVAGSIIYDAARMCRFERGLRSFTEAIKSRLEFMTKLGRISENEGFERSESEMETLGGALEILSAVEEKLSGFAGEMSPEKFGNQVRALVAALNLYKNIARVNVRGIPAELVERDSRALAAFFEVLDEVVEVEIEKGGVRLPSSVWMENLRAALSLTRYNVRQKYGYGVYVTSLEEIRGLEFDYLFIVGLNEGELPAKYDPEIFLPLRSQEENRATEPYLQRHLFYQAVSSFRKKLFLVYPLQRGEARLPKSSFIGAMEGAAEIEYLKERISGVRDVFNVEQMIESESLFPGLRESIAENGRLLRLFPPNTQRCRVAEMAKYADDRESEFAGKLTDAGLISRLERQLGDKVYSAAQLESLSRCGFQYFAMRILRASDVPEIETSLSAMERGEVLHRILYRFYSKLSSAGGLSEPEAKLNLLLSTAREVLDEFKVGPEGSFGRDLFEVERDAMLGTDDMPGTLQLFLSKVQAKLTEYGFSPARFEVGFGMNDGTPESAPVKIGGVMVRGKIDRIDSGRGGFTIFDYKTSSRNAGHADVIRDKINPQLIIYMNALARLLDGSGTQERVAGAAFISINRTRLLDSAKPDDLVEFIVRDEDGELKYNRTYGSTKPTPGAAGYPKTIAELLLETEKFVGEKVAEAKSGRFNLTKFPPRRVCTYCPYIEACRISLSGEEIESGASG